jgi:hypothetical protein
MAVQVRYHPFLQHLAHQFQCAADATTLRRQFFQSMHWFAAQAQNLLEQTNGHAQFIGSYPEIARDRAFDVLARAEFAALMPSICPECVSTLPFQQKLEALENDSATVTNLGELRPRFKQLRGELAKLSEAERQNFCNRLTVLGKLLYPPKTQESYFPSIEKIILCTVLLGVVFWLGRRSV